MRVPSDHEWLAYRLGAAFDDPLVLIVVRNQLSFLKSFYVQLMKSDGLRAYPPDGINEWIRTAINNVSYRSLLNLLKYDEMYEAYVNEMGAERVSVLYFEDLLRDWEEFARSMARILDVDEAKAVELLENEHRNSGVRAFQPPWLRTLRKLGPLRVGKWITPASLRHGLYQKVSYPAPQMGAHVEKEVSELFEPHNRRFKELTGVSLHEKGYPA
jgi:hypothetical protein